jgi:hypothetical protein
LAGVAEFQARFPEYECVDDTRIEIFISDAVALMDDPTRWLSFYDAALMYLSAHLLFLAEATASGDGSVLLPVRERGVDDVVIKFSPGPTSVSDDDLYSTSYGKQYIKYRRLAFTGVYGV